jgi:site-specific DNA-cytosine methylase
MRVLELFAGTQSLATVAQARGHEVTTLDVCPRHGPTICMDIMTWDYRQLSQTHFHYIHASCPCESYSRARSTGGERPLEDADKLVQRTLDILDYFSALWTIENPAGSLLWKRPVAERMQEKTRTSYCSYGFLYHDTCAWTPNKMSKSLDFMPLAADLGSLATSSPGFQAIGA